MYRNDPKLLDKQVYTQIKLLLRTGHKYYICF